MKPTDALSIVSVNTEAVRRLEAEAQALSWPIEQLRKGRTLPPSVLIDVLEAHQKSCRTTAGALALTSTLLAEEHRPRDVAAKVAPWWRRWFRAPT